MDFERSAIFTCLLENETFRAMPMGKGSELISKVHEAWQQSSSTDMLRFTEQWLAEHPEEVSA
jgi:hypothetical protein